MSSTGMVVSVDTTARKQTIPSKSTSLNMLNKLFLSPQGSKGRSTSALLAKNESKWNQKAAAEDKEHGVAKKSPQQCGK